MDLKVLRAIKFACIAHAKQKRKGNGVVVPYLVHPLQVTERLVQAHVDSPTILCAAVLHDVVEDTDFMLNDISKDFGDDVAGLVQELTNDMTTPLHEQKAAQLTHAATMSKHALWIKVSDKICNVHDLVVFPPTWDDIRKAEYAEHAVKFMDIAEKRFDYHEVPLALQKAVEELVRPIPMFFRNRAATKET